MAGIDQQQVHFLGKVGNLDVAVSVDRLDVPVLEQAGGVDVGAFQLDIIPGMVVEQDNLHVLVLRVDRVDGADQHHRGIGAIVVDLVHFLYAVVQAVRILRMQKRRRGQKQGG